MPFVLAALGDLLVAAFTLALAYAVVMFGQFLARILPDINILSFHLRSGVESLTADAGNWLINTAHSQFLHVRNLLVDVASVIDWPLRAIIGVLDHHATQLSHVVNTTVPAAVAQAKTDATTIVHNVVQPVKTVVESHTTVINDTKTIVERHTTYLHSRPSTSILHDLANTYHSAVHTAESWATRQLDAVHTSLTSALQRVTGNVDTLAHTVAVTVPAEIAKAAHDATATLEAALGARITSLQHELSNLGASLDAAIAAGDHALAQQITGNIDSLRSQLDTVQGQQALQGAQVGAIGATVATTLPVALAAIAAKVATLTAEADSCFIRTCEGPNNVTQVVKSLLHTLMAVGEFGFLAEAIKDPTGTAAVLSPVLDTIDKGAVDGFNALLSLV